MRNTKHIHLLLSLILLASGARAQNGDSPRDESVAAARSQYTLTADISTDANDTTLAQLPRGVPRRAFPRGYPRATYQTPWTDHGNAGHILIGAAIGFGVGAALGANHSARDGTPVGGGILIGGGLLGFIGGCVGQAVGTFPGAHYRFAHRRRVYRPSWLEDDEQTVLKPDPKAGRSEASDYLLLAGGVVH